MRTLSIIEKVLLLWTGCCAYCHAKFFDRKNSSLDKIAGYEAKSSLVIDKVCSFCFRYESPIMLNSVYNSRES